MSVTCGKNASKPAKGSSTAEIESDTIQLHVELGRTQYKEYQDSLRKLGYRTVSETVREHIRKIIAEAGNRCY